MRNIRLTIAYDGTEYVGWQIQPNGISVQAVVERAIHRLTSETPKLLAAGRTDSGVHALGQVANFHTQSAIPCEKLRTGLQRFLPDDVIIREVDEVPAEFHATYSAKTKRYRYVIFNSRLSDPFVRKYAWCFPAEMNLDAMSEAAKFLLGTHDFRCFESQFPNKATSVRTISEASVARRSGWELWNTSSVATNDRNSSAEPFLSFDVVADGFLYNMVRAIVGTLVKIGRGAWSPDAMQQVIENQDRSQAGDTAPARGLYLVEVHYESQQSDAQLTDI